MKTKKNLHLSLDPCWERGPLKGVLKMLGDDEGIAL